MNVRIPAGTAIATLVFGTLSWSAIATAQDWAGRGRVQGLVTNEQGQPVAGAKVTLRQAGGSQEGPAPIETNANGRWSFLGLTGGPWKVEIEAPGYAISEGVMPVSEFGGNEPLKITLVSAATIAAGGDTAAGEAAAKMARATEKLSQAGALIDQQKYAEGRAVLETALADLEPSKQPAVLLAIARTHFSENHVDLTISTLERALAINPNDVESLRLIASVLVNEGRPDEAKVYQARLPAGETIDPMALLNQGIKKYNANDLDGALEDFNGVVATHPTLADALYYRGLVHLGKAMSPQAIADFEKMLELDPNHANAGEARQFLEYLKSP